MITKELILMPVTIKPIEWISVYDRLPKMWGAVLVHLSKTSFHMFYEMRKDKDVPESLYLYKLKIFVCALVPDMDEQHRETIFHWKNATGPDFSFDDISHWAELIDPLDEKNRTIHYPKENNDV